jgi:hypothetical protein
MLILDPAEYACFLWLELCVLVFFYACLVIDIIRLMFMYFNVSRNTMLLTLGGFWWSQNTMFSCWFFPLTLQCTGKDLVGTKTRICCNGNERVVGDCLPRLAVFNYSFSTWRRPMRASVFPISKWTPLRHLHQGWVARRKVHEDPAGLPLLEVSKSAWRDTGCRDRSFLWLFFVI